MPDPACYSSWQLHKGTSCSVVCILSEIFYWLHVASSFHFPLLPNPAYTVVRNHCNPLLRNCVHISPVCQVHPVSKYYQSICICCLSVLEFIWELFQMVPPPDIATMLFLQNPSYPYIVPHVGHSVVGLSHQFGKLLQGGYSLLQAG